MTPDSCWFAISHLLGRLRTLLTPPTSPRKFDSSVTRCLLSFDDSISVLRSLDQTSAGAEVPTTVQIDAKADRKDFASISSQKQRQRFNYKIRRKELKWTGEEITSLKKMNEIYNRTKKSVIGDSVI